MSLARATFDDRKAEFEAHLKLMRTIQHALADPKPGRAVAPGSIEPEQQRILTAGLYVHLYNVVEATVSVLIKDVETAVTQDDKLSAKDLSVNIRTQWLRSLVRDDEPGLGGDKRLQAAREICEHLLDRKPLQFKVTRSGGGNWDDGAIRLLAENLGVRLEVPDDVHDRLRFFIRDEKGPMRLLKDLRNGLAHGSISFKSCGESHTVEDVERVAEPTLSYLDAVVASFEKFIAARSFMA